jgi:hypothetical protein
METLSLFGRQLPILTEQNVFGHTGSLQSPTIMTTYGHVPTEDSVVYSRSGDSTRRYVQMFAAERALYEEFRAWWAGAMQTQLGWEVEEYDMRSAIVRGLSAPPGNRCGTVVTVPLFMPGLAPSIPVSMRWWSGSYTLVPVDVFREWLKATQEAP